MFYDSERDSSVTKYLCYIPIMAVFVTAFFIFLLLLKGISFDGAAPPNQHFLCIQIDLHLITLQWMLLLQ